MSFFIIPPLSALRRVVCPINCSNALPVLTLSPLHKKLSCSGTMKAKILTFRKGIEQWPFSILEFRIIITCWHQKISHDLIEHADARESIHERIIILTRETYPRSYNNIVTREKYPWFYNNMVRRENYPRSYNNFPTREKYPRSYNNIVTREKYPRSYNNIVTREKYPRSYNNTVKRENYPRTYNNFPTREKYPRSYKNMVTREKYPWTYNKFEIKKSRTYNNLLTREKNLRHWQDVNKMMIPAARTSQRIKTKQT